MTPSFIGKASLMVNSRFQGPPGVRSEYVSLRDATQSKSLTALTTRLSQCEFESYGASHRPHRRRLKSQNRNQSPLEYCIVLGIHNRGFPDVLSGDSPTAWARHIKLDRLVFRSDERGREHALLSRPCSGPGSVVAEESHRGAGTCEVVRRTFSPGLASGV